MKKLYDQIDSTGMVVASGVLLVPGLTLPKGHRWAPHTPSLEALKAEKRAEIEQYRDQECFKPAEALGYIWQADRRSQELITSALTLSQLDISNLPKTWRTLDNLDIPIDVDSLKEIASAISFKVQAAYAKSWALKEQVDSATTSEQVKNVNWS